MKVRKINDSEYKRTLELFGIAFEFKIDAAKSNDEMVSEIKTKIENGTFDRGDMSYNDRWAAFTDDGDMMSFMITTPYEVNFDGHECTMSGIGGVSSLPQYRRSGGIRACFETNIPDMYDNGFEFSYLYPFSTAYYRKFGYEISGKVFSHEINMRNFKRFNDVNGKMSLNENGNELDAIKTVYNSFACKYNMMVMRKDFDFNNFKNNNPATDATYTYVYKDENNTPLGVLTFTKQQDNDKRIMDCQNVWFSNINGLKGIINHILAYTANFEVVKLKVPTDVDITMLIPEWSLNGGRTSMYNMGMARVVNVDKVLSLAKYKGDGECTIAINDDIVKQNNNTFKVCFKEDKAISVTVCGNSDADISMPINQFSRLILGEYDLDSAMYDEAICIHSNLDTLSKVFYKKPLLLCDYF